MALISFEHQVNSSLGRSSRTRKLSRNRSSQRSRSIQILSNRNALAESVPDIAGESYDLREHYNFATLQMYNRIVDYRVRHPLTYLDDATARHHASAVDGTDESTSSASTNQLLDSDAIFEMDI